MTAWPASTMAHYTANTEDRLTPCDGFFISKDRIKASAPLTTLLLNRARLCCGRVLQHRSNGDHGHAGEYHLYSDQDTDSPHAG